MASFDITINKTEYSVESGEALEVAFTVTNLKQEPVEAKASVQWAAGSGQAEWAEIVGGTLLSFAAKESRTVTVKIAPPANTPADQLENLHRFQLVLNDLGDQSGASNESVPAALRIEQGGQSGGFPWWILIAAIVGIGAIVGGALFFLLPGGEDPKPTPEPTADVTTIDAGVATNPVKTTCDTDRDCEVPRVCIKATGQAPKCLLPDGERGCKTAADCVSNSCMSGICSVPLKQMGEACADDTSCAGTMSCFQGTCRLQVNEKGCTTDAHCVTDKCQGGSCVSNLPGLQQACSGVCAEGLTCSNDKCLFTANHRGCRNGNDCTTGYCVRGMCLDKPTLNQRCDRVCAENLTCSGRVCKLQQDKRGCRSNLDCMTGYCTSSTCRAKPKLNQPCTNVCDSGMACSNRTCKIIRGQRGCRNTNDCVPGSICQRSTCRTPRLNEACTDRCDGGATCKTLRGNVKMCKLNNGSVGCRSDGDCADGICGNGNKCARPTWPACTYTGWVSEEGSGVAICPEFTAVTRVECSGGYCDNMRFQCCPFKPRERPMGRLRPAPTRQISEENKPKRKKYNSFSSGSGLMVGVKCSGRYCDNINGFLVNPPGATLSSCRNTGSFSEESRGMSCPKGYFVNGMTCSGRFCDNKTLRCCAVPTQFRMP